MVHNEHETLNTEDKVNLNGVLNANTTNNVNLITNKETSIAKNEDPFQETQLPVDNNHTKTRKL